MSAACQDQTPDASIPTLSRANDGLYPGGYYQLMGLLVSGRITVSVLAMRMLSWVMCIGLLGAAAALAARPVRRALLIGVLATAVPMAIYLFASVNPSGLCIAAIATLCSRRTRSCRPTSPAGDSPVPGWWPASPRRAGSSAAPTPACSPP